VTDALYTGPLGDHRRYRVALSDGGPVGISGGEGLVFEATDGGGNRYALKMLTAVPLDAYGRLVERLAPLSSLRHPHLMRHVEVFLGPALMDDTSEPPPEDFDVIFTVAEWVDGQVLTKQVEDSNPHQRLSWLGQVAQAADYLHCQQSRDAPNGIVHRDIKPSNIRIDLEDRAVLMDFGIARPNNDDDHTRGAGTFNWQAPEVLTGPDAPGPAADIWAIGAVGHWMLTGEPPRLEGRRQARERLRTAARSLELGDQIGLINHLSWPLESRPEDRPQDLARWARELHAIGARRRTPLRHRRGVKVAALAAAGVPLLTLGTTAGLARLDPTTPATVAGRQIQKLSIEDPWEVPCDGRPANTPGSGAPPGSDVRYQIRTIAYPAPTTTTSFTTTTTEIIEPTTTTTAGPTADRPDVDIELGPATVVVNDAPAPTTTTSPSGKSEADDTGTTALGRPTDVTPQGVDADTQVPDTNLAIDTSTTAFDNGSFLLETSCVPAEVGWEWTVHYEATDGQSGQATVRAVEPIREFEAPLPSDGGPTYVGLDLNKAIPPTAVPVRPDPDISRLGLENVTMLSSNPEVLTIERLSDDPDLELGSYQLPEFLFKAVGPGETTITVKLRSIVNTFKVIVAA